MQITLAGSALTRPETDAQTGGLEVNLAAFDGQVGTSTIPIPDPAGADEIATGRAVNVSEGSTVLLDGIIVSQGRERGPERTGAGKQDTYQVEDPNTFLYGFRVAAWVRPEETDYERIQAFFDTYLPGVTTTEVLDTSTETMVAATYNSDGVSDIMRDAIDVTGKTLFLHDLAEGGICAHYHALTGGHICGLEINDTSADGVTTFYPQNPASRVRDGHELKNDLLVSGAEGVGPVWVTDPTSIAANDIDGKLHQTFVAYPDTLDVATLTLQANRLLDTVKQDRDTWTVTIGALDDTALALIRVGDIITVTSTAMTLSGETQRISEMRLRVAAGTHPALGLWDAELTLGAPVRGPAGTPTRRSSSSSSGVIVQTPGVPYQCYPVGGQSLETGGFTQQRLGAGDPFGSTTFSRLQNDDDYYEAYWSIDGWATSVTVGGAFGTDTDGVAPAAAAVVEIYSYDIVSPVPPSGFGANLGGNVVVGSLLATVTLPTGSEESGEFDHIWFVGPVTVNFATPQDLLLFRITETDPTFSDGGQWPLYAAGPSIPVTGYLTDPTVALAAPWSAETCANAPYLGQSVPLSFIATADGSTDTYSTPFSYAPGSLRVLVDRIDWTNEVTETDPAAGTFTFETPPLSGDDISAYFVGGY